MIIRNDIEQKISSALELCDHFPKANHILTTKESDISLVLPALLSNKYSGLLIDAPTPKTIIDASQKLTVENVQSLIDKVREYKMMYKLNTYNGDAKKFAFEMFLSETETTAIAEDILHISANLSKIFNDKGDPQCLFHDYNRKIYSQYHADYSDSIRSMTLYSGNRGSRIITAFLDHNDYDRSLTAGNYLYPDEVENKYPYIELNLGQKFFLKAFSACAPHDIQSPVHSGADYNNREKRLFAGISLNYNR